MKNAINPLDGRYEEKTKALAPYASEEGLMRYRVMVECEFLIALSASRLAGLRRLAPAEIKKLRSLYGGFSDASHREIKAFEKATNHDVKAVEYFIKARLGKTSLKDCLEWTHFGLTSEDTNNLAYALMLSDALGEVIMPELGRITADIGALAKKYANLPMLARTHGQSASPTTFGKEMRVFSARLGRKIAMLESSKILAKLNGATGNYNAFAAAYPKTDWMAFTRKFIKAFNSGRKHKLEANLFTAQIEPHDSYAEIFDLLRGANTILLDFAQDMWRYISDGWIGQRPVKGETGSSTMPHKVNPIDFENAEGNLGLSNALLEFFSRKLPVSRLQRDLSDSTVERAFGTALGHSYLAYLSLRKGLGKITVNQARMREDLLAHPEVIAEALQTVLRREKYPVPYERLKDLTRGREVSLADFRAFIDSLDVSPAVKKELAKFSPEAYTGLAARIARL